MPYIKPKPEIYKFKLKNGADVEVHYERGVFGGGSPKIDYRHDHFEFHGEATSSTGYRSHFCTVSYDNDDDWRAFAREMAEKLHQQELEESKKNPLKNNLSLF